MSKRIFVKQGESMSKVSEQSPTQSEIQEQIAALENLRDFFQASVDDVLQNGLGKQELQKFLNEFSTSIKELDHKMLVLNDSLSFRVSTQAGEHKNLKQRVDEFKENINKVAADLILQKHDLQGLTENSKTLVKQEAFSSYANQIDKKFFELASLIYDVKGEISQIKDEFKSLSKKIENVQSQFETANYGLTCEQNRLSTLSNLNCREIDSFKKEFDSMFPKLTAYVREEIKSIELPQPNASSVLPVEEIQHKLHLSGIEVSNATLKANNAVMQIQILEKKLENLALQLKKFELNK